MIYIKKAELRDRENGISTISVPVIISNKENELWYSFETKYRDFVSIEVADAYVIAFLLYALQHSLNIKCDIPISEQLLYSLRKELIPFFATYFPEYHHIEIEAEVYKDRFHGQHVGTGLSCGIDSLSTIIYHGINEKFQTYKIDTLTLLNTGYYMGNNDSLNNSIQRSKRFAEQFNYNFLFVDTNISELTNYNFNQAHTYLTNSTILLFQKYFRYYYYASGVPLSDFNLHKNDCAYYDIVTFKNISTQSLTFYSGCSTFTRVEKTSLILQYPDLFKYLFVCIGGGDGTCNCSECEKCIRTMLALDALGKKDCIDDRFDINVYNKNRIKYISYALRHRRDNVFYREIIDTFKKNNIRIPIAAHLCILPCKFEVTNFKSRFVKTRVGGFVYNLLKSRQQPYK